MPIAYSTWPGASRCGAPGRSPIRADGEDASAHHALGGLPLLAHRRFQDSLAEYETALCLSSDFAGAHRVLTCAAGMAGTAEVAQAALAALRRAQPDISLAWIAANLPILHDAEREH